MAEIRVAHKRHSVWPWILGLVLLALVIWMVSQAMAAESPDSRSGAVQMEKAHPASTPPAVVAPGRGERTAPRPATEQEEALRLRSRVVA